MNSFCFAKKLRTARGSLLLSILILVVFSGTAARSEWEPSGKLEIHYINIGQGGATLIIGPNGKRILYDFGKVGGDKNIVPYIHPLLS